jgi:aerobic carbon-monoxide dehydrogenase small subunit
MDTRITLTVNGREVTVRTDGRRPLLEVLREDLDLRGTKYGCGESSCGACTVLIDGKVTLSCQTPVSRVEGRRVLTIEGLARGAHLHPVQKAFLEEQAFQCGYCTPGMILAAVALLEETPNPSEAEIVAAMDGNLCRCCGYPGILSAVQRAAKILNRDSSRLDTPAPSRSRR